MASSSTPTGVYRLGEKKESAIPGKDASDETAVSDANATSVDFWMPFTDTLGIYGEPGLVITDMDLTDSAGELADFGSSDDMEFSSSDSWMSTEGCVVVPEDQAQTIYQNVDSGLPIIIY